MFGRAIQVTIGPVITRPKASREHDMPSLISGLVEHYHCIDRENMVSLKR